MARKKDTNVEVLQAARNILIDDYSLDFSDRIDDITQENIANIYEHFLGNQGSRDRNLLVTALYDLVGLQTVRYDGYTNPMALVKSPDMPWGGIEQEIYTNFAKGHRYNPLATVADAFRIYRSHTMLAEHTINFKEQYAVTITRDDLRSAFLGPYGLDSLITSKRQSLVSGYQWDEFLCSKRLVKSADDSGVLFKKKVDGITTEDDIKMLLVQLEETAQEMISPNPEYTVAGATSSINTSSDLVLVTTPAIAARVKVLAQAYAYNYEFLTNRANQIIIDKAGFNDTNIIAFLCDRRWFNIRNHFIENSWQDNGASLNRNEFLTIEEMFSYSPFMQAVGFSLVDRTTTGISIDNATASAGDSVTIPVTFTGTDPLKTYEMRVVGNTSVETVIIPGTNLLMIGKDEKATQLTVMVETLQRSETDSDLPAFTDTAVITITGNASIVGVTVTPSTATVAPSGTEQFSDKVTGVGTVSQEVTWSVIGDATVSTNGLVTVGANATGTIQVIATSNQDNSKQGVAVLTVS